MYYTYYKTRGNKILFRYKKPGETKTHSTVIDNYKPTLYAHSEALENPDDGEQERRFHSIHNEPLYPLEFESIKGAKEFGDKYKHVENFDIEGNSNFANQMIIEMFNGQQPAFETSNIRIGFLDLEVDADSFPHPDEHKYPINAITFYDSVENHFYTLVLKPTPDTPDWSQAQSPDAIIHLNVTIEEFNTEYDLLVAMCEHFGRHQYDLTTGWNSESFDMPYIVFRCYHIVGKSFTQRMLSPFGIININEKRTDFGKVEHRVDIMGQPHLDYMQIYKKHVHTPRESYKLDFIASEELGLNKISYEESQGLYGLYRNNYQLFIDYNIQDTNLVYLIDQNNKLFDLVFVMAYYSLSNFQDTMGTVKIWEQLIASYLYNQNMVPPYNLGFKETRDFEGAFVKPVEVGKHEWVISEDLDSLYPHIEMQWNIGPETIVPYEQLPQEAKNLKEQYTEKNAIEDLLNEKVDLDFLKEHDLAMSSNVEFYRRDKKSFFSAIKDQLYKERKGYKKTMKAAEQEVADIKDEMKRRGLEV